MNDKRLGWALLGLFVVSGFAGLIYQSVWSHYLGLTLGHAAYAQTLVLAIFMGGMAGGAWFVSRRSLSWRRLILGYAVVELVIGVGGLLFQPLFEAYTAFSQQTALPSMGSAGMARGYQWITAALLILPQSLLLGATFPLMSAGYLRTAPSQDGEILGGLYFTNSLGAALGALAATFLLLPAFGLPGTVLTAGILNIVVAVAAWAISKSIGEGHVTSAPNAVNRSLPEEPSFAAVEPVAPARVSAEQVEPDEAVRLGRIVLWSTGISAAASFVYEIGWVRMLNQAFGATVHSFELMLAAFILGLAFGGLWIRKRARLIKEPMQYVGYVQVLMGIAALVSVPVFAQSFQWVGWIMGVLSRTEDGYLMFELGTAAIALLVMFPAAFFAGMTLPLFTVALLRVGSGERVIGRIYAANTLGAIVGVALMVHLLIPAIGVKLAVVLGGVVDVSVGLYLLRRVNPARLSKGVAFAGIGAALVLAGSISLGDVDPIEQASGVFRTGTVSLGDDNTKVQYLRDGKTATVAVYSHGENQPTVISTNGKPDASLTGFNLPPTGDEPTMVLAGLLPLVLHPDPRNIAVIGWGSGLTTHTVLGSPVPEIVDTIEIEKVMHDAARLFGDRVARAYDDPRSHLRIDDARTFFSTGARKYDVIISEPSNPWVSGVAGLFTHEFYGFLRGHLEDDGMLVQWLHTYEINDELVATMMAALVQEFEHADVYVANDADLLIVASNRPTSIVSNAAWDSPELRAELERLALFNTDEVQIRRLGGVEVLRQFVRVNGAAPHSDFYPTVSLEAPKTRFMRLGSDTLQSLVTNGLPVLDVLECRNPVESEAPLAFNQHNHFSYWRAMAGEVAASLETGQLSADLYRLSPELALEVELGLAQSGRPFAVPEDFTRWSKSLSVLAHSSIGHLPASVIAPVWAEAAWIHPAIQADEGAQLLLNVYTATAARDPAAMREYAQQAMEQLAPLLAPETRAQLMVIAQLGALGTGDAQAVSAIDEHYSAQVGPITQEFGGIRAFLLAWADSGVPACIARSRQASAN